MPVVRARLTVRPDTSRAQNCPECGRTPAQLTWVHFSSPAWTWQQLCGREGWLTLCDHCGLQIDFFLERMN